MAKITKHGKIATANFVCTACGCEFSENTRKCSFSSNGFSYGQDGTATAFFTAETDCPECGYSCESTDVIFTERESGEEVLSEEEKLELLKSKIANPPAAPEDPFKKMCPKW